MKNSFKYISDLSEKEFDNNVVLPFYNEKGRPCILIKNSKQKNNIFRGTTDNIEYHLNTIVQKDGKNHYVQIISCLKDDGYSKEQFTIAYDYLFKLLDSPKSDVELGSLINSLEQLFKVSPEKDLFKLHVGVYGELLFLYYFKSLGCEKIIDKYHSNFYLKHDLELNKNNRIEVKTSVNSKRIHHFSHDQLYRKDVQVYVGSIILEESSEDVSLNELFNMVIAQTSDPSSILWFGQLKGFCGISKENVGPSFSFDKACHDIKVFYSKDLPHLEIEEVKGISNVSYDVDCSMADNLDNNEFANLINQLTK